MVIREFSVGEPLDVTGSVAFGGARSPGASRPVHVIVHVTVGTDGTEGRIAVDLDGSQLTSASLDVNSGGLTGTPNIIGDETISFPVQPSSSYTVRNVADPLAVNAINDVTEIPL